MASKLGKAGKASFEIANLLDDAADAIRKRSKRAYGAGRMSLEEYMEARSRELELRAKVSVIVATDLGAALEGASGAGESVDQAIRDAKGRIESVKSIRKGLEVVAALVRLAGALASGNAELVLTAGKGVAALT